MEKDSLSKSLSQFMNTSDSFSDPFDEETEHSSLSAKDIIADAEYRKEERKKRKKKDSFSKVLDKGNALIQDYVDDDFIDDFDGFIGNYMLEDEDVDLKRNLIRQGRKYARETKVSGESSEITKAYSESEKLLSDLLEEIDTDKELVQKDISGMRLMRTRNYKALSDLIQSKANFHNTALSVIKEMNNIKKNQFDLQMKVDKTKKESEEDDSSSNKAIQQLFGIGRGNILDSIGGYSGASGAHDISEDDSTNQIDSLEDEAIHKKYFSDGEDEYVESDGDKFIRYENLGVHYILLYDEDGHKDIIAEDKDGNLVPDYPMPSDPDNLEFSIDESTNTATDNLTNNYELRKI